MTARTDRQHRGRMAFHAGIAAEMRIRQDYERRGFTVAQQRWRGQGGEIDLVFRDGATVIFVEVKKSRCQDLAAQSLSDRQMQRITASAEEFIGGEPLGSLTEVRFDVALVDRSGEVRIIENAFGQG